MSHEKQRSVTRVAAVGTVVLGLAAGSYGIASAASGSGSDTTSGSSSIPAQTTPPTSATAAPDTQHPWGSQRSDETLLTGETATKVREAALAKVDGGTIVRVETDADGHAAYEAHMLNQNGSPVTVYVDQQFNVVSVESR